MSRTLGPAGEKEEPFLSLSKISLSLSLMSWAGCLSYRSQWEFLFPSGKERQMGRSKLVVCVILFFSQRSSIVLSNARRRWGVEELVNGGGE